jgi:hypothetical protein
MTAITGFTYIERAINEDVFEFFTDRHDRAFSMAVTHLRGWQRE